MKPKRVKEGNTMKKALLMSLTATTVGTTFAAEQVAAQEHTVEGDIKVAEVAKAFATTADKVKELNPELKSETIKAGTKIETPEDQIVEVKEIGRAHV